MHGTGGKLGSVVYKSSKSSFDKFSLKTTLCLNFLLASLDDLMSFISTAFSQVHTKHTRGRRIRGVMGRSHTFVAPVKSYWIATKYLQIRNSCSPTESSTCSELSSRCWVFVYILKFVLKPDAETHITSLHTQASSVCLWFSPLFGLSETYSSPLSSFVFLSLHFAGWRWGIDQKQNVWAVLQDPPVLTDFKAGCDCVCVCAPIDRKTQRGDIFSQSETRIGQHPLIYLS